MGIFVAHQTVKTMASAGIGTVGKQVIVLGLTFKENSRDLRNTGVADLVATFESFNCNVDVYDPWLDKSEAQKEYNITPEQEDIVESF